MSGECLEEDGHVWVGVDVSRDMLGTDMFYLLVVVSAQGLRIKR